LEHKNKTWIMQMKRVSRIFYTDGYSTRKESEVTRCIRGYPRSIVLTDFETKYEDIYLENNRRDMRLSIYCYKRLCAKRSL
jgi:hypothetical protein